MPRQTQFYWRSRKVTGYGHFLHQVGLPLIFLVSGKYNHPGRVLDSLGPTNRNTLFIFNILLFQLCECVNVPVQDVGNMQVLVDKDQKRMLGLLELELQVVLSF